MASTAAHSGLRWGELSELTIPQLDQAGRVITVDRKVVEVAGHLDLEAPKNRMYLEAEAPKRAAPGARDENRTGSTKSGVPLQRASGRPRARGSVAGKSSAAERGTPVRGRRPARSSRPPRLRRADEREVRG
jgi:hypothetical protein